MTAQSSIDMTGITRIAIGELHTRVCVDDGPSPAIDVELGIGLAQLGRGPFRHEPPSELELESAIAFVEDSVMPLAKVLPPSTKLVSSDAFKTARACAARSWTGYGRTHTAAGRARFRRAGSGLAGPPVFVERSLQGRAIRFIRPYSS